MRTPGPAFDLRAALSKELRAAIDELASVQSDAKAVHRCRVRVKRARALARIGRACAPGLSSVFIGSTRALMRNLALTRDSASLCEAARAAAKKSGKHLASTFDTVVVGIEAAAASQPGLNPDAARAALKDLLALAQVWPEASHRQIRQGAKRLRRRAQRARRHGAQSADPLLRHDWRSREKDRFYAAALLGDFWPGKRRRRVGAKIGEALGAERDALLLMERLAAEPELAGKHDDMARTLKKLNRRRSKFARRADALAQRLK
ncbi:MAG: CHAD domain-containing protein [Hyphomonadaceae bacterium]